MRMMRSMERAGTLALEGAGGEDRQAPMPRGAPLEAGGCGSGGERRGAGSSSVLPPFGHAILADQLMVPDRAGYRDSRTHTLSRGADMLGRLDLEDS
jgi:hypothetical protein